MKIVNIVDAVDAVLSKGSAGTDCFRWSHYFGRCSRLDKKGGPCALKICAREVPG